MNYLFPAGLITGLIIGIIIMLIINRIKKKESSDVLKEIINKTDEEKAKEMEKIINNLKESFGSLSLNALTKNSEEFLRLANTQLSKQTESGEKDLEGKKKLIDQSLGTMKKELENVQKMVTNFEKDREGKYGELTKHIQTAAEQTAKLQVTTNQLSSALASTKVRGQWGERMAEDVLRLAGFIEGINYEKQKALQSVTGRPDFTFFLPQDLKVNMDVKFPLDNYMKYLEADNELEKESYKKEFLKNVKTRIKEVTSKDYINPADNTVDYVIVFIPNEQVYGFINEQDRTIIDDALKNKVIICSPITLYAILAIIRQAVDNFNFEKTASEILSHFGTFYKQWKMFIDTMDRMGKRIEEAQKEYNNLTTTRKNQLEKPLTKIEELRKQKSLPVAEEETIVIEEVTEDS